MARTEGQKVKLLVLADLLARETDGAHGLTVPQIIAALAARGIAAERKSINLRARGAHLPLGTGLAHL